jgi:hypothetical protein
MTNRDLSKAMERMMTRRERDAHEAAVRAATRTSQDFPIPPTSEVDALPHVPEEPGDNLTPAKRLAVAALVAGQTFCEAARVAGVNRRTLYEWRQEPAFKSAVERTSRDALDVVVVRVRNLMLRATRVVGEAMNAERESSPVHAMRVLNSPRLWSVMTRSEDEVAS